MSMRKDRVHGWILANGMQTGNFYPVIQFYLPSLIYVIFLYICEYHWDKYMHENSSIEHY